MDDVTGLDTALGTKQASITGGASTITAANLAASRALVSDDNGKVTVSPITGTKLGYLSDVTGNIQAQINTKFTASKIKYSATQPSMEVGDIWLKPIS